jgi:hypothetical protein
MVRLSATIELRGGLAAGLGPQRSACGRSVCFRIRCADRNGFKLLLQSSCIDFRPCYLFSVRKVVKFVLLY